MKLFGRKPAPPPSAAIQEHGHYGDFASFAEAMKECGRAYEEGEVLEVSLRRTKDVRHRPEIDPLFMRALAAIEYAMMRLPAKPRILDYGGALGSYYFFLRGFLPELQSWTVVELAETVELGNAELADGVLRFSKEIEPADIVLASGALQYTEAPYDRLRDLLRLASFVILDKVPLWDRDRLTVQRVNPSLFKASFPCWVFSRERFASAIPAPVMSWDLPGYAMPLDGRPLELHKGFLIAT